MDTHHQIILGDSRRMGDVNDKSVHLVVTSPPYWQLKDYGDERQLGFHHTYEQYVNHLSLVWSECARVLHPGCRLCVNIGDQFARSAYYGRYKVIPIRTEIIKFCEAAGLDYMGAIIWQKVTTCNTSGGATIMGSFPHPRNGILKLDYEFILIFKKLGKPPKPSAEAKQQSTMTTEEWNTYFAGHWQFVGERQKKHLAMFPEELPRRLIRMFSFVGDTVLDPFLGSGTTCLAASRLGRHSIGYEINHEFLPLIEDKLGLREPSMFADASFDVTHQPQLDVDWDAAIARLPYVFKDPVPFDKKVDPRKDQYGSKIDGDAVQRQTYHAVKEVLSPELVVLDTGETVRLLGVKTDPRQAAAAVEFLQEKTRGQKVFMKFDKVERDAEGRRQCYLHLRNKTHLNAHLIKQGLAQVDTEREFRHRARFIRYRGVE